MYKRLINIPKDNSFFLFGARGTGKSTLLNEAFSEKNAIFVDLLDPLSSASLLMNPQGLSEIISQRQESHKWIVIDEIQKIPSLLDVVHRHIEKDKVLFALTGSSARKLKRGAANLLAGRAFVYHLHPLTAEELGNDFSLEAALNFGTLPKVCSYRDSADKKRFLSAYTQTYLQEEILVEQLVRKLAPFRRFLDIASQSNGKIVNYSKIAADINSDHTSVRTYFQILEDTLVGLLLDPFHESIRKRQRQSPKFYFFDTGVARALSFSLDTSIRPGTYEYGIAFETFIINEIRRIFEYNESQVKFSYLRTKDDAEIDLIVERAGEVPVLIEIKSNEDIRSQDVTTLAALSRCFKKARPVVLYRGNHKRKIECVEVLPWREGIREITS